MHEDLWNTATMPERIAIRWFGSSPLTQFELPAEGDAGYDIRCIERVVMPAHRELSTLVFVGWQYGEDAIAKEDLKGDEFIRLHSPYNPNSDFVMSIDRPAWFRKQDPRPTVVIHTGLHLEIPSGFVGLIMDKSSVGVRGVKSFAGVIDSTFRGEVKVVLCNFSYDEIVFEPGQKIAQMLFIPVGRLPVQKATSLEDLSSSTRGEGGFGSTGKF